MIETTEKHTHTSKLDGVKKKSNSPRVEKMTVIPVAGHDSMLLNLSGAHSPYFTRNIVILEDNLRESRCRRGTGRRSDSPDVRGFKAIRNW